MAMELDTIPWQSTRYPGIAVHFYASDKRTKRVLALIRMDPGCGYPTHLHHSTEEVLVVRVHDQILDGQKLPQSTRKGDIWKRRYREINVTQRFNAPVPFADPAHGEQRSGMRRNGVRQVSSHTGTAVGDKDHPVI